MFDDLQFVKSRGNSASLHRRAVATVLSIIKKDRNKVGHINIVEINDSFSE